MKKAQGISINTIIIAAIALIVLGIVAYLLMSSTGKFQKGVAECEKKGGKCMQHCTDEYPIPIFHGCYDAGEYHKDYVCCIKPD